MPEQVKRPDRLLMLPVIVWALTFAFGTVWLFFFMNTQENHPVSDVLIYSLTGVISINIAVLTLMLIASSHNEKYRKEIYTRMYLMLVNIPVAALYFILMCR